MLDALRIKLNVLIAAWAMWSICLLLPSCQRDEQPQATPPPVQSDGASTSATTSEVNPIEVNHVANQLFGADANDDPKAPRALPRTNEVLGWIKTQAIRVATGDESNLMIDDPDRRSALKSFRYTLAARCTYQKPDLKGEVLIIEAETPQDAFGIFSVLSPRRTQSIHADESVRIIDASLEARTMFGWQGRIFLEVLFTGRLDEQNIQACNKLFDRIVFNVPKADPPLLMQVIPGDKLVGSKIWLVRSTSALVLADEARLQMIEAAQMDTRLGLTGDELLTIAAIKVGEDERPNLIWLVQYQAPTEAQAAYQRYQQVLKSPITDLDRNTITYEPMGEFLVGSWAADQESIQHLLDDYLRSVSRN